MVKCVRRSCPHEAVPGFTSCDRCLQQARESSARSYRKKREKLGLSVHPRVSLEERFWSFVPNRPNDPELCWVWEGAKGTRGYGMFGFENKMYRAHRFAWTNIYRQQLPEGFYVLHRCDNPVCVRRDHLFVGTQRDNVEDMATKDRHPLIRGKKG